MADGEDLHARVEALEARIDAMTAAARAGQPDEDESPTSLDTSRPSSRAHVSRRGLLSAAAGAVAGGATSLALGAAANDDVAVHVGAESGAHEASAITVTPGGEIVATDVLGALGDLDARLGSLLQFSPDYLQDYACAYDDFFGGSTTSGQVGTLGWQVDAPNGGTLVPASDSIENMPGWYELSTGSSAANGSCALHLEEISLHGHPLFAWEARVSMGPSDRDVQDATWRIGLHDALAGEPTNGYWFEGRGGGSSVLCRMARGGEVTDVDSGVTPNGAAPNRFRIMSDGGGAAYFSIDDEPVAVMRAGLPSAAAERFGPVIAITKTAASGTARSVRVDYVYLLWGVSR
jgi:hypothetical protein